MRSSRVVESQLADFLVFLRRILSLRVTKRVSTFIKWIDPLMTIISYKCTAGNPVTSIGNIIIACFIVA